MTLMLEEEVLAILPIGRARLTAWIAAEVVVPVDGPRGAGFGPGEQARLRLACELCEAYDLPDDTLALVLTLVDRLHRTEADLAALARAVAAEEAPVRRRLGLALRG